MKKTTFAWLTEVIDFDNLEEALRFIAEHNNKSAFMFTDVNDSDVDGSMLVGEYAVLFAEYGKYVTYQDYKCIFGEKVVDGYYSVEMKSRYKDFECGW